MKLTYFLGSVTTVQVLLEFTNVHAAPAVLLINMQLLALLTTEQSFPLFVAEQVF